MKKGSAHTQMFSSIHQLRWNNNIQYWFQDKSSGGSFEQSLSDQFYRVVASDLEVTTSIDQDPMLRNDFCSELWIEWPALANGCGVC